MRGRVAGEPPTSRRWPRWVADDGLNPTRSLASCQRRLPDDDDRERSMSPAAMAEARARLAEVPARWCHQPRHGPYELAAIHLSTTPDLPVAGGDRRRRLLVEGSATGSATTPTVRDALTNIRLAFVRSSTAAEPPSDRSPTARPLAPDARPRDALGTQTRRCTRRRHQGRGLDHRHHGSCSVVARMWPTNRDRFGIAGDVGDVAVGHDLARSQRHQHVDDPALAIATCRRSASVTPCRCDRPGSGRTWAAGRTRPTGRRRSCASRRRSRCSGTRTARRRPRSIVAEPDGRVEVGDRARRQPHAVTGRSC